jgi:hypothetical protein
MCALFDGLTHARGKKFESFFGELGHFSKLNFDFIFAVSAEIETAAGVSHVRQHLLAFAPMAHASSTAANLLACFHGSCVILGASVSRIVSAVSDGASNCRKVRC